MNLRRMLIVWGLLAASMAVVALACWATMPRGESPAIGVTDTIIWPEDMAPSRHWKYIVIHHSATPSGTLESIDQGHRDRGFSNGAGYHFLINNGRSAGTFDGQITPTHRWVGQLAGAHTKVSDHPEFNNEGIGICLIGNFDQHPPTPAQMTALETLVLALRNRYDIPLEHIVGHGELKNTHCPGRLFPMDSFLMALRQAHLRSRLPTLSNEAD